MSLESSTTEGTAGSTGSVGTRHRYIWWTLGGIGILAALMASSFVVKDDELDFNVTTQRGYPGAQGFDRQLALMSVQSRNEGKVVVKRILVNNDDKCLPTFKGPMEMAMGDIFSGMYLCNPVKVTIETNSGKATYSMDK